MSPAAQLAGRRSWQRGQTAGRDSIPRWSTGKPQVVTRRKATGASQKKIFSQYFFRSLFHLILRRPAVPSIHLQDPGLQLTANPGHRPWSRCKTLVRRPRRSKTTMSNCRIVYSNVVNSLDFFSVLRLCGSRQVVAHCCAE